ncbi:TetR/AcrR family transcriptional regulator [Microbacterium sp. SORGH_AS_0862]|uniref:TetR/AcrR family transcriptional regulator n=1 Tax=Microbacterium sp. SORGH_AS_0862 TaxID=3041789 RepID=UPI00278D1B37|nr:TetR/AcrR family transcriptional regulator [Microbacterium sp. SORGH_AS_0862]MDQ1204595.1 AcrR family transcriptional regulator [Microbacterium sp. SORGH_AS_0862]
MSEQPSIRERYTEQTRRTILLAVAECMESDPDRDFSMSQVAARAGVSVRTVFRHFASRDELVSAFGAWYEQEMLPFQPLASVHQLPDVFARSAREMHRRPALSRAIAMSSVGRDAMTGFNALVLHQLQDAVETEFAAATEAERRRLVAGLHYLDSITSYVVLHDDLGLSGDEVGEVVGWMMRLAIGATSAVATPVATAAGGAATRNEDQKEWPA